MRKTNRSWMGRDTRCRGVAVLCVSLIPAFLEGERVGAIPSVPVAVKSIGLAGRQFATLQAWEDARGGNLITRQVWSVTPRAGKFTASEVVSGGGCSGRYRPEDGAQTNGPVMTVDEVSGRCTVGAVLTGLASGATATFSSLVSAGGTIEKGAVYNDGPLTGKLVIGGSKTDATHYVWLTAAGGHEHNGTPGNGARVVVSDSYAAAITVLDPYVVIEKLEVVNTGAPPEPHGLYNVAPTGGRYHRLIVQAPNGAAVYYPSAVTSDVLVHNSRYGVWASYSAGATIYNATLVKLTGFGVLNQGGVGPKLVNVAVYGAPTAYARGEGWAAGTGHNAGPAAVPGPNGVVGLTAADFANYAGGNYRPSAVSRLVNAGAAVPGVFTDDVGGANRTVPWDIGAHEAVGPPDPTAPVRSAGAPTGVLGSGTASTVLSLSTNERATCRYGTVAGTAYWSLPATFATTRATSHSQAVSGLTAGNTYTYYVRCQDESGNANLDDYAISFAVAIPAPSLTALSPSGAVVGGAGFTLTVHGSGFVTGAAVRWNGGTRPTTFVSATRLTATIAAGDIAAAGAVPVTAVNPAPGGQSSNTQTFTVAPTSAALFDTLADNTWLKLTTVPTPRYWCNHWTDCSFISVTTNPAGRPFSGFTYGNGRIFYCGGGHGSHPGNDVEIFDVTTNMWRQQYAPEGVPAVCLTDPTADPACVIMRGGNGGPNPTPHGRPTVEHVFQEVAYDPINDRFVAVLDSGVWAYRAPDQWTRLATTSPPAGNALNKLLIWEPTLQTLLYFTLGNALPRYHRFDFATNSWTPSVGSFPDVARFSRMYSAYDPHRLKHLVAHWRSDGSWMWWFDALFASWTPITNVPPGVRNAETLAYDPANRVWIVAQGETDGTVGLWLLDELDQWTALQPAGTPPEFLPGLSARWHALQYDPINAIFYFINVKYGGSGGWSGLGEGRVETWVYRYRRNQ